MRRGNHERSNDSSGETFASPASNCCRSYYSIAGSGFKSGLLGYSSIMNENTERRIEQMQTIHNELLALFLKKNIDYGDSFAEYGPVGVLIRIGDKLKRLETITKNGVALVDEEALRDTAIDLANYAVMLVMLLDENNLNESGAAS